MNRTYHSSRSRVRPTCDPRGSELQLEARHSVLILCFAGDEGSIEWTADDAVPQHAKEKCCSTMLHRTLPLLSKRIVMPRLSPTHTTSRIVRFEVANEQQVSDYDPIMIVECSPDLVTEAFRESPDEKVKMMVDSQDEGVVKNLLENYEGKWLPVETELGIIDDGDPIDGDWTWQAYLHTDDD